MQTAGPLDIGLEHAPLMGGARRSFAGRRARPVASGSLALWCVLAGIFGAASRGIAHAAVENQAAPGSAPTAGEDLERRLIDLEKQVAALKAELERLAAGGSGVGGEAGGGGAGGATAGGGAGGAVAASLTELERRIEALSKEIERLRIGAAAAPQAQEGVGGLGPAASKVYRARAGVSIGGYGEATYLDPASRSDDGAPTDAQPRADLQRAVLYFGYKFDDHFLFNSEIEFEHAVAGEGEKGEVEVEFAYVDYRKSTAFGARGGLLLVPLGFINELHEPPTFLGVQRPEVEQVILPTTWRELGGGVYGQAGPVTWRAYLVNSLDAAGFSADQGIREGRQEGAEATAADLALTARLDWVPVQGLLLGAGAFAGDTAQGADGVPGARLAVLEAHAEWRWSGLRSRALFARSQLDDAGAVSALTGQAIGSRQAGYYVEAGWNVLQGRAKGARELTPFARYEAFDTQAAVPAGLAADPANDRRVRTIGVSYLPIPNIAIKADWQDFGNAAGTGVDRFNLGLGWLF